MIGSFDSDVSIAMHATSNVQYRRSNDFAMPKSIHEQAYHFVTTQSMMAVDLVRRPMKDSLLLWWWWW